VKILGIDTSCDDTSVAVVEDGKHILSNVISSQFDLHEKYGGIVPELASRKHIESINYIIFYHWSATLIVAIFLWIEEGLLEPVRTAASSLVCNINREIVEDDVRNLEAQMKSIDCLEVLNRCQNYFAKFDSVDRREYFVNRLLLAQLQYSFEKGDFNDSRAIFSFFMEQKAVLSQAQLKDLDGLYGDLLDLVGNGFSVRRV
jgi:hypothetical protein|tara:strand:+ start:237 stop:842 length:606 start_codon:yes stop_codon:yes gene_type:complete